MPGPSLLAHISVESVLIVSSVVNNATRSISLNHAVLATDSISIAALLVGFEVSAARITDFIRELPLLLLLVISTVVVVFVLVVIVVPVAVPPLLLLVLVPVPLVIPLVVVVPLVVLVVGPVTVPSPLSLLIPLPILVPHLLVHVPGPAPVRGYSISIGIVVLSPPLVSLLVVIPNGGSVHSSQRGQDDYSAELESHCWFVDGDGIDGCLDSLAVAVEL